jgi:hypothetical protein
MSYMQYFCIADNLWSRTIEGLYKMNKGGNNNHD